MTVFGVSRLAWLANETSHLQLKPDIQKPSDANTTDPRHLSQSCPVPVTASKLCLKLATTGEHAHIPCSRCLSSQARSHVSRLCDGVTRGCQQRASELHEPACGSPTPPWVLVPPCDRPVS